MGEHDVLVQILLGFKRLGARGAARIVARTLLASCFAKMKRLIGLAGIRAGEASNPGPVFYAVHVGRVPGVYESWADSKKQVHRYLGALHRSFGCREAAASWVSGGRAVAQARPT